MNVEASYSFNSSRGAGERLAAALQTANAVNPTTAYGTWSCSYDETSGFNQGYVIMSTSGACAEQYYTSGWYWNSGTGTYVPWGPEDWVNGPGGAWQKVQLTTRQYAYGRMQDTCTWAERTAPQSRHSQTEERPQ